MRDREQEDWNEINEKNSNDEENRSMSFDDEEMLSLQRLKAFQLTQVKHMVR